MDFNKDLKERLTKYLCIVMECFLKESTEAIKEAQKWWQEAGTDYKCERSSKDIKMLYESITNGIEVTILRSGSKEKRTAAPLLAERLRAMQRLIDAL